MQLNGISMGMLEIGMSILAVIGSFTVFYAICVLVSSIIYSVKNKVRKAKVKKVMKNRFKKKPMAECYCIDCEKWNPRDWTCSYFGDTRRLDPNLFCWRATMREENLDFSYWQKIWEEKFGK